MWGWIWDFWETPRKVRLQLGFCLLSSIFVQWYLLNVEDFNTSLPQNNTGLSNPVFLWCTQAFEIFSFEWQYHYKTVYQDLKEIRAETFHHLSLISFIFFKQDLVPIFIDSVFFREIVIVFYCFKYLNYEHLCNIEYAIFLVHCMCYGVYSGRVCGLVVRFITFQLLRIFGRKKKLRSPKDLSLGCQGLKFGVFLVILLLIKEIKDLWRVSNSSCCLKQAICSAWQWLPMIRDSSVVADSSLYNYLPMPLAF